MKRKVFDWLEVCDKRSWCVPIAAFDTKKYCKKDSHITKKNS